MIAVLDPFTGLAGDMFLAALLDAGAALDAVRDAVTSTGLTGWSLSAGPVSEHGLHATRVQVTVTDSATERRAAELIALAGAARPRAVADAAVATLGALAAVEGRLHGVAAQDVHLHELGGHDTLIDIVGVCAALHDLDVTRLHVGALPLGRGTVRTRHGVLPVPAPATAALLAGATVTGSDLPGETVTPTAAALLATLDVRWDPPPPFVLARTGYGAGTRQLPDRPNVAVVRLGAAAGDPGDPAGGTVRTLTELATTVDDVTGETLGYVLQRLLDAGALDAWITPAVMKKSRPGQVLHVLAAADRVAALRAVLFRETGTLGVRATAVERHAVRRTEQVVRVDGRAIRVKRGPHGTKPEHDDVAAAAAELDRPLREIARRALEEAEREPDRGPDAGPDAPPDAGPAPADAGADHAP